MHGLSFHKRKQSHLKSIIIGCIVLIALWIGGIIWIGGRDVARVAHIFSTLSSSLESIKSDVEHFRYSRIQDSLAISRQALAELKLQISSAPTFTVSFSPFQAYQKETLTLISLVDLFVSVGYDLSKITIPLETILLVQEGDSHIKELSEQDKKRILDILTSGLPSITGSRASLDLLLQRLEKISDTSLPSQAVPLKQALYNHAQRVRDILDAAVPYLSVAPALLGHDREMTYLLLFQNNAEVRATGGFIGSYGILTLRNGEIKSFFTDNIYNFDDNAKHLRIPPPKPLRTYGGIRAWYLRDSNWSPDFPTAARQALWFYAREGGTKKIDAVLTLTPDVISSLMRIVGPVSVEDLNFDPDQLRDQLEYQVEKGYERRGIARSERKDVIRLIADELIRRIAKLSIVEWEGIFGVMRARLAEKTLMAYTRDSDLFQFLKDHGWSGEVLQKSSDYLMVVDSNIISLKTDAVMDKKISYTIKENDDGVLKAKVLLTYTNNGTFSWTSTTYKDYVRILIPQGSSHISSPIPLEISQEHGKMVLGAFIEIEPQKTGTLSIEYQLPKHVEEDVKKGLYTLFVQKQSGVIGQEISVVAHFVRPIASYSPLIGSTSKSELGSVEFESLLQTDKEYSITFK
ncbi:MAG: DUF4012 domain-containing protein [Patescibacteria group bacterium]